MRKISLIDEIFRSPETSKTNWNIVLFTRSKVMFEYYEDLDLSEKRILYIKNEISSSDNMNIDLDNYNDINPNLKIEVDKIKNAISHLTKSGFRKILISGFVFNSKKQTSNIITKSFSIHYICLSNSLGESSFLDIGTLINVSKEFNLSLPQIVYKGDFESCILKLKDINNKLNYSLKLLPDKMFYLDGGSGAFIIV